MDLAEIYFAANSITYTDSETDMVRTFPRFLFKKRRDVEHRQITIPDDSTDDYALINFGDNIFVEHIYNMQIGRIYNAAISFTEITAYTALTDYSNAETEYYAGAYHGDGILVDTESTARNIVLQIGYQDKTSANMYDELKDILRRAYYYLYIEDNDSFYSYIRRLSMIKENLRNENTKTRSARRVDYSSLTAYEL